MRTLSCDEAETESVASLAPVLSASASIACSWFRSAFLRGPPVVPQVAPRRLMNSTAKATLLPFVLQVDKTMAVNLRHLLNHSADRHQMRALCLLVLSVK
jgi:hypothetical protein